MIIADLLDLLATHTLQNVYFDAWSSDSADSGDACDEIVDVLAKRWVKFGSCPVTSSHLQSRVRRVVLAWSATSIMAQRALRDA